MNKIKNVESDYFAQNKDTVFFVQIRFIYIVHSFFHILESAPHKIEILKSKNRFYVSFAFFLICADRIFILTHSPVQFSLVHSNHTYVISFHARQTNKRYNSIWNEREKTCAHTHYSLFTGKHHDRNELKKKLYLNVMAILF